MLATFTIYLLCLKKVKPECLEKWLFLERNNDFKVLTFLWGRNLFGELETPNFSHCAQSRRDL